MTPARDADEARAVALLQHLSSLCDETRRVGVGDPGRIGDMLLNFQETLATLAPILERVGQNALSSRDVVLAAARQAEHSHQALVDAMALELERLRRAIMENDRAVRTVGAYATASSAGSSRAFEFVG